MNFMQVDGETKLAIPDVEPLPNLNLLELPVEVLENVFSYLSYEAIGKIRPVCKRFNEVCSSLLSSAFQRLQSLMLHRFQKIKGQMPRRESARRKHPLARESDIIETLHMRLTLLQMSFGKHIERKHCCFFAGEILDEVYRIMRYIKTTPSLARAYKVTDELFDLSTMAMEYFKEYIEPTLPEITYFSTDFLDFNNFSTSTTKSCSWKLLDTHGSSTSPSNSIKQNNLNDETSDTTQNTTTLKRKLKRFRQDMKRHNKRQASMFKDLKRCRSKLNEQDKQLKELSNRLEDFTKKNEGSACKFSAVLQELNKCKTELQYWRSKSPANSVCCQCGNAVSSGEETRIKAFIDNYIDPPALSSVSTFGASMHQNLPISNFVPMHINLPIKMESALNYYEEDNLAFTMMTPGNSDSSLAESSYSKLNIRTKRKQESDDDRVQKKQC